MSEKFTKSKVNCVQRLELSPVINKILNKPTSDTDILTDSLQRPQNTHRS